MINKNIKKGMFAIAIIILSSCNNYYTVATFQPDQNNGSNCPNPIYIATMSKSAEVMVKTSDGYSIPSFNQQRLTLVSLLSDARVKYGEEVTIHNIRWDIKNKKKKTGVIYDVIKCN